MNDLFAKERGSLNNNNGQIMVKYVWRIFYWPLNAGGRLFQVFVRTEFTVIVVRIFISKNYIFK